MDKKKITDLLSALTSDYRALFHHTMEIKKVLSNDLGEDIIKATFEKRGLLLEKLNSSIKYYEPINKFCNFTDSTGWDSEINELMQQMKQELNAIVVLNEEIVSLIKLRISDITSYLVKIQEGKQYVTTIKMHERKTPSLVDMCG